MVWFQSEISEGEVDLESVFVYHWHGLGSEFWVPLKVIGTIISPKLGELSAIQMSTLNDQYK
jgi:hypothetical protein